MARQVKKVLFVAVVIAFIASLVVAFVKIGKLEKTKDLSSVSYSIGTLNEQDGAEKSSDYALRTGYQKADKFNKIELAEKADVVYVVFYYNTDKEFIGKTEDISQTLSEIAETQTVNGATEKVKYFRVVVKVPETKEKVTLLNKGDYVKQITVTLNK